MFNLSEIQEFIGASGSLTKDESIKHLLIDSRKSVISNASLFFCIKGQNHDAHQVIPDLVEKGVTNFVIEENVTPIEGVQFLKVDSTVKALQKLVTTHRSKFQIPVIGITGSNGKTIVKEWLGQLLNTEKKVVKSPKSYNSQIGVPLSVWELNEAHEVGIFEAGISKVDEMKKLAAIIQPTLGVFTSFGSAHDEGFASADEKFEEKAKLFEGAERIILKEGDQPLFRSFSRNKLVVWGEGSECDYRLNFVSASEVEIINKGTSYSFKLPFTEGVFRENLLHAIVTSLELGVVPKSERIAPLKSLPMRLSLKKGVYGSEIIDDTYNNDLVGLKIALDFMEQQRSEKAKTLILSSLYQSGLSQEALVEAVQELVKTTCILQVVTIGQQLAALSDYNFANVTDFLENFDLKKLSGNLVLVKGARDFKFENLIAKLEHQLHETVFEVNFEAFQNNLNFFRKQLKPETKLMVMVKAFAYGSGHNEVAHFLEHNKVEYLGVAYTDEGINLRQNGVQLPIMVMNPRVDSFQSLYDYGLEAEIYSEKLLDELIVFSKTHQDKLKIHLKLDTGMHRLGFEKTDQLLDKLKENPQIEVLSVFSHLATSDEPEQADFVQFQVERFKTIASEIDVVLGYKPMRHIVNSAGIQSFPDYHFDMVRLGIGLYGIGTPENQDQLKSIGTLKTTISQIKEIPEGETIGYGRKGKASTPTRIATIAIGYADGYDRRFSNGVGKVSINGQLASVIGNVCMDMTMVDISNIEAQEGDEVIVFGENPTISDLAKAIGTIPYEILTNVGERVKRVFLAE